MNPRLQELIAAGESRVVEFKAARTALNHDLYQTVCAFLNRDGGDILLGIKDDGTIQGVAPDRVQRMKEDFATAINNPQKLNPPCYLSLQAVDHDGAILLHLAVPPSSQVHRCNNRIYDRNEDGDFAGYTAPRCNRSLWRSAPRTETRRRAPPDTSHRRAA